ncbi:MAG: DNA polymerase III subunit delta, partial [Pseudomonadota bacterium]
MKLAPRDAPRFLARPDPAAGAILIHGGEALRIADRRERLVAALLGPNGAEEMRLTRLDGAALRSDPAALQDALRATGFFSGQRVVELREAGDGLAPILADALETLGPEDAFLVVTAGQLTARSALRKLFEGHKTALSLAVYADPPGRDEIAREIAEAGLKDVTAEAEEALSALAHALEPGDFRGTLTRLALYMMSEERPVGAADVAAIAPPLTEAGVDAAVAAAARGAAGEVGPTLRRLAGQGVGATTVA